MWGTEEVTVAWSSLWGTEEGTGAWSSLWGTEEVTGAWSSLWGTEGLLVKEFEEGEKHVGGEHVEAILTYV